MPVSQYMRHIVEHILFSRLRLSVSRRNSSYYLSVHVVGMIQYTSPIQRAASILLTHSSMQNIFYTIFIILLLSTKPKLSFLLLLAPTPSLLFGELIG